MEYGSQKIDYTSFIRYFSEVYVGEITKRIILKSYKRKYYENGNSEAWENAQLFLENRSRIINTLKNAYPVQKIIKTERKINQSCVKFNFKNFTG